MLNTSKPLILVLLYLGAVFSKAHSQEKPNIILIYTDDLGYGDLSCYGATAIRTPHIDRLAKEGRRFTHAHATSATCTPSRYSLLTGQYAWRRKDTGIAPGNASLLIDPGRVTFPSLLQQAGYQTAVVGKWHLGLGGKEGPDWNGPIMPGPLELGFDYSFIIPATVDRVPCVFVEGHRVVNYDPADPIRVDYQHKIGNEPTGRENPERLTMKPSHGHDQTIVNGISRIGYMTGGKKARWRDEEIAGVITSRANAFIQQHANEPFFLYFSPHDIHVPRVPHKRFAGKSNMGARGDVILQLDWSVGEILKTLDENNLTRNTIIIFSSDNGPVVDDGYQDQAVEKLGKHTPAGGLRGGKYSAFEAGTRVPFIVRWPGQVKSGTAVAAFSQIDLLASFSHLVGNRLVSGEATDSFNALDILLGKTDKGRAFIVEHALNSTLSLIQGDWKYIEPSNGPKVNQEVNIELGNHPQPQLYNISVDTGEADNLAGKYPEKVKAMELFLSRVKDGQAIRVD